MCGLLNTIKPGHMKSCPDGEVWAGTEACVLQRRGACRDGLQNSCLCIGSHGLMRTWGKFALQLASLLRYDLCILTTKK